MSTFIEVYPVESNTKRTTAIRLDDDFRITIREEGSGPVQNIRRNYTGLETGQEITGTDPVRSVRVVKLGQDERCIITVNTYHRPDEEGTIPRSGLYWYDTSKHYDPDPILFAAKREVTTNRTAAPNSDFTLNTPNTQQFSTTSDISTIFNISQAGALPTSLNTVTSSYTLSRVYTQLGAGLSATNALRSRRNHLKQKLQQILEHPDRIIRLMNAAENIDTTVSQSNTIANILTSIANSIARPRSFVIWLEMWANIISNDGNYDSELKFNLMDGELGLSLYDLVEKPMNPAYGTAQIQGGSTVRSNWHVRIFGTIGNTAPYKYTEPTATAWPTTTTTHLAMPSTTVGRNWEDYIRSREELE